MRVGSDGNLDNRTEHRLAHCNGECIRIVIDDTTSKRVKPFPWKQVASISDVQYYPLASRRIWRCGHHFTRFEMQMNASNPLSDEVLVRRDCAECAIQTGIPKKESVCAAAKIGA